MSNKESAKAEERKRKLGYTLPSDRESCSRCFHSQVLSYEPGQLRCVRNAIKVHKLGICPQFSRTRPGAGKPVTLITEQVAHHPA